MTGPSPPQYDNDNSNDNSNEAGCVQVAVRVRPMLPHEAGNTQCIEALTNSASVSQCPNVIRLGGESGPKFTFDQVFALETTQTDVYQHQVAPLVNSCLQGYNATILAYGQTGSGKTHTIMGPSSSITTALQDETHAGVIPRAIRTMFEQLEVWRSEAASPENDIDDGIDDDIDNENEIQSPKSSSYGYDVRVQFLEVYGEEIRDLLTSTQQQKLSIRDVGLDEPEVVGATEQKVDSPEEALLCLTRGMYRRVTGATAMNASSSRSHAIFSLIVEQSTVLDNSNDDAEVKATPDTNQQQQQQHVQAKRSKFNFVDLAGSERQKRTQATGQRLKEGIDINKGLLVLGNVISALGDPRKQGKTFVPYRDSKLTRLLKGSLGGNHKTLMIACVSPARNNMEETLNCLRYANRAKNIKNHAVVNVDATSRMVAELKGKLQLLAADLLKARDGNLDDCTMPIEVVQSFANGGDGEQLSSPARQQNRNSLLSPAPLTLRLRYDDTSATLSQRKASQDELQKLKASNEVYRLQLETMHNGETRSPSEALQQAFVARAAEYEREIAILKASSGSSPGNTSQNMSLRQPDFDKHSISSHHGNQPCMPSLNLSPRTPNKRPNARERSESPELSRLRAQVFGSMSQSTNLDAEVEEEEKAVEALTTKYLGNNLADDDDNDGDSDNIENDDAHRSVVAEAESAEHLAMRLEAEMFELSNSINAKEELIQKLQVSQEKYETMREFYEEKLREMESLLTEKEHESEKLSDELKKMDQNNSNGAELAERLRLKRAQVTQLKRKQAELTRLTTVASRNESQISKLRNDVVDMKQKKVDMQKQIISERKSHMIEVQKLKKESMQKDRELNKVKKTADKKTLEAQRAQQMAKSRLEQMNQLKNKYKQTEKRLRMKTVKRGVMNKAGLDPVLVGRRQPKNETPAKRARTLKEIDINVDALRDFFDQKVANVGRREALAEKLAQEWEEHLELSIRQEELGEGDEGSESMQSLESEIKYKEERIRQLASRLGKRQKGSDESTPEGEIFMFDQSFKQLVGNSSPMASVKIASKVLFGMIVRERRRIASLARSASSLDEKVQEAEAVASAKDAAFRAYVDEQRLEAVALAQNQQEHILSLMDMVREEPTDESDEEGSARAAKGGVKRRRESLSGGNGNSKLLVLANERVAVLERQLHELQLGREAIQKHREREDEARALLDAKTKECENCDEELADLRAALRHIREEVTQQGRNGTELPGLAEEGKGRNERSQIVRDIVIKALHPSAGSTGSKPKRRRRSSSSKGKTDSPALSIKRQIDFVHTSDSDEVPDWADDIMKDLAIIAEGKMPSSLLESMEIVETDDAQVENTKRNVFDRLANPESFTGTQKSKKNSLKGRTAKKARPPSEQASEGQRQRKVMSKQIFDSLDKLVIPGEASKPTSGRASREKASSDKRDSKERSVFDRLLSPSNLTGTQKQKFQAKQGKLDRSGSNLDKDLEAEHSAMEKPQSNLKRELSGGKNADYLLDNLLVADERSGIAPKSSSLAKGTPKPSSPAKDQSAASSSCSRRENHKDLNVFERLNKTTTQAYAVKQHVNIAEKMLDDLLDETEEPEDEPPKPEPTFDRVEEYIQQNVFERLQKTTTRAYVVKQNNNLTEKLVGDILDKRESGSLQPDHGSPARSKAPDPHAIVSSPSSGVFERLQKTTTEAYAKKKNPPVIYSSGHDSGEISHDARNFRSGAIETGSFSNVADQVLDDILDSDVPPGVTLRTGRVSPIARRLRSRRRADDEDQQPEYEGVS